MSTKFASMFGNVTCFSILKLVDLFAAVPLQHRKMLVPKQEAKPIQIASGIRVISKTQFLQF
jgi:hypothetical protein